MTNINDQKYAVVSAVGTELAYLQSLGATANNVNDAWMEVFLANGATSTNFNAAAAEFLAGGGYTGSLPDMWGQYWAAGGGTGFSSGFMTYDGTTGYYSYPTMTSTGNKVTFFDTINVASSAGNKQLIYYHGAAQYRLNMYIAGNDHATTSYRDKLIAIVSSSAPATICLLVSNVAVADAANKSIWFSFDGDIGAATFKINGSAADDTGATGRVAPTTGTLDSGASSGIYIGRRSTAAYYFKEKMGYVGLIDAYLTNDTDFFSGATPLNINTSIWTEFGSQPLVFQKDGDLSVENLGTLSTLTKSGTITGPA